MLGQLHSLSGFHGMDERWQLIFGIGYRILFFHNSYLPMPKDMYYSG